MDQNLKLLPLWISFSEHLLLTRFEKVSLSPTVACSSTDLVRNSSASSNKLSVDPLSYLCTHCNMCFPAQKRRGHVHSCRRSGKDPRVLCTDSTMDKKFTTIHWFFYFYSPWSVTFFCAYCMLSDGLIELCAWFCLQIKHLMDGTLRDRWCLLKRLVEFPDRNE